MLEIINRDSIPKSVTGRPLSQRIADIFDALTNLAHIEALKYTCENERDANYLLSNLIYHRNKRHRPGIPTIPNLRCIQRGTVVFIWLEKEWTLSK